MLVFSSITSILIKLRCIGSKLNYIIVKLLKLEMIKWKCLIK